MYLSGGPGGAGIEEYRYAIEEVGFLNRRYALVGFDQRGTGRSALLRCPALERDVRLRSTSAGEQCAASIGPNRALFTTRTTVDDLESIRVALGAEQLILFGVSYGTKVALAYARAHPDRVERLILDSVVDPDDPDPFALASYRAIAPSLRALCPARCDGLTADPAADLAALVAALRAHPLRGTQPRPDGSRARHTLTPTDLLDLMFDGDYLPQLRAALPAAVRSAIAGDAAPLLRLRALAAPLSDYGSPRSFAAGRYATVCEEAALPWPRGTASEQRESAATALAGALPAGAFAPFDFAAARQDVVDLCLRWPEAPAAPALTGSGYPDVPVLILQGGEDVRTPPEVSAAVAAKLGPKAQRVLLPGIGHAALGSDYSGCAGRVLRDWAAGRDVRTSCPRLRTGLPRIAPAPRSLAELAPRRGLSGRLGRTVTAIDVTLQDLLVSLLIAPSPRAGGLRGGSYRATEEVLTLRSFEAVPGVQLSGRLRNKRASLRITGGAAARGRITIERTGRLTGVLGGRRVRTRLPGGGPPGP